MSKQIRIAHSFATLAVALVLSVSAQAGATRTFVSTTGNDSNTSSNCGSVTPCRTFTAALTVTNSGGEIVVLTCGGYGPAMITQSVVITAIGVDASITQATSGQNALTVNTSGNVTITGLGLHGQGMGNDGILVNAVGVLNLHNIVAEGFVNDGVEFNTASGGGKLLIYDSTFNDNGNDGIQLIGASSIPTAYVHSSSFDNNLVGASSHGGQMTIADSSASNNEVGFLSVVGGSLVLLHDSASFNTSGLSAGNLSGTGQLYFADCVVANNTKAWAITIGSTMAGTNPGTSLIAPGQGTTETLSTPVTLQ
jgi:hypothetical protein